MSHLILALFCAVLGYYWGRADERDKVEREWDQWIDQQQDGWLLPVRRFDLVKTNPPDEAA